MPEDYRRFLKPDVVSKLSGMEIKARLVVEGFIAGLHKSPYHGFSVEFAEHRQYMPGDPLKNVDWKVYAKTDRFFIKEFEEETNLKAYILVDASRSMAYGSKGNLPKYEWAGRLAACLAYLTPFARSPSSSRPSRKRPRSRNAKTASPTSPRFMIKV